MKYFSTSGSRLDEWEPAASKTRLPKSLVAAALHYPVWRSCHLASLHSHPREREVLGLLATGATNRVIADRLVISEKTASVHVSRILEQARRQ